MLVTISGAVPVLVTVKFCGALVVPKAWNPKFKLGGFTVTTGVIPFPVRLTVKFVESAGSALLIVIVAEREPWAVGVKVTLRVQAEPFVTTPLHVSVSAKSPACGSTVKSL